MANLRKDRRTVGPGAGRSRGPSGMTRGKESIGQCIPLPFVIPETRSGLRNPPAVRMPTPKE